MEEKMEKEIDMRIRKKIQEGIEEIVEDVTGLIIEDNEAIYEKGCYCREDRSGFHLVIS